MRRWIQIAPQEGPGRPVLHALTPPQSRVGGKRSNLQPSFKPFRQGPRPTPPSRESPPALSCLAKRSGPLTTTGGLPLTEPDKGTESQADHTCLDAGGGVTAGRPSSPLFLGFYLPKELPWRKGRLIGVAGLSGFNHGPLPRAKARPLALCGQATSGPLRERGYSEWGAGQGGGSVAVAQVEGRRSQ